MKTYCLQSYLEKPLSECTDLELYNAALAMVRDAAAERSCHEGKKKLYYISAEFLIGKLLSNNLINLGLYDSVKKELCGAGKSLTSLEELENEPSLGNGGLGRLAACFLDSCATTGIPAEGVGLAYHCGLFKQVFAGRKQYETPDTWLTWGKESWMKRCDRHYTVNFGGFSVTSTMYEITVTGYNSKNCRLRLFDCDGTDETIIKEGIRFDKTDIARNLTLFLYPDDSDGDGRLLRVYQEYFMVSNAAQMILEECMNRGSNLHDLADYAAIQINDTHPTMIVPELIRLLTEHGIAQDESVSIVSSVCAYTNHTILAEALETWPRSFIETAVPQLIPVIEMLDERVRASCSDPSVRIIDKDENIHMAHIDIHYSHSVNGVAALHTEILEKSELRSFYDLYPERFNNKTNGVSFRRWLISCNPALTSLITDAIGEEWKTNADELSKLLAFENDRAFLSRLLAVKAENKKNLTRWVRTKEHITVDGSSVFDMQAKRLHEYKRQQLNLLWLIREYQEIKAGKTPAVPVTVFFGAKAAPAYTIAKDIIHAILCMQEIIEKDPAVSKWLRIVMIENYNVTAAEKMIPACDISEQISLASKEASGTSNMKLMLNGAVTLGTMDGANVEIARLVGENNIYTFGESSDEVIARYRQNDYHASEWYEKDKRIADSVDFLTGASMRKAGDRTSLERLQKELIRKDYFMTFPDFESYCETKAAALSDTRSSEAWAAKMLNNIANAGFFSSDRTVNEYNRDIWKIQSR